MAKTEALYQKSLELAKEFDDSFLDLAKVLRQLQEQDPERFRDFFTTTGVGRRKAYYLVAIDKAFSDYKVPKPRLRELGWTKLMVLSDHANKYNYLNLIEFAENHTVKELQAYVKNAPVENNAHSVLLYFNPEKYSKLMEALVENGAVRSGRGLVNKEEALIRLIEKLHDTEPDK